MLIIKCGGLWCILAVSSNSPGYMDTNDHCPGSYQVPLQTAVIGLAMTKNKI